MLSEKVGAFRADRTEKVGAYRAKNLKKGVFSGAHTRTALLWEYPSPRGRKTPFVSGSVSLFLPISRNLIYGELR